MDPVHSSNNQVVCERKDKTKKKSSKCPYNITKICSKGNINDLKRVPLPLLTKDIILTQLKNMNFKLIEIDNWKSEYVNRSKECQYKFCTRQSNIAKCIHYLDKGYKFLAFKDEYNEYLDTTFYTVKNKTLNDWLLLKYTEADADADV